MSSGRTARINKYALYEKAVQSPDIHIEMFVGIYRSLRGKFARRLREDFCGTFQLSCAWVKRNRQNSAICLDLDPEPLAYGRRVHLRKLKSEQKKRLQPMKQDVMSVTAERSDVIIACNFSFYIFKKRLDLLRYFRAARKSLAHDGMIILEMAGGPGMIESTKERRTLTRSRDRKFTYIWHQKSFDPIQRDARYAIHFKFPGGKQVKDAFTYDWRIWTIPEVREALEEAGFTETKVYWESSHKGEGTGEFAPSERGDNAYAWIAYIVGCR